MLLARLLLIIFPTHNYSINYREAAIENITQKHIICAAVVYAVPAACPPGTV